ncbi:glycerophosphodiester phosphodiesterase [Streptomyces sp. ASQP_92]|uniref:glycerophosphodiester phosphodiesterase n=1 Tax=Streptomyces sp. ASQP_92 TaxID=2979116 RepID=UPI0021C03E31|nr:glycerophosphodiester phosphodiesterase [Streptomyces sp. ASQP_92]MCT9093343.1 glycerophosphodiester phosphodiesterase [Streptomyces sp. ASQP_92]
MRTVTAVAHRGAPYRVRENTLPSIASALERGADAVEIDVRTTRDGVPVLLHDETLKRLWDFDRPLAQLPYDEVREVTGGGVPTLRRALITAGAHRVLIDLPGATEESLRTVVNTVRECGAGERVYYCAGPVDALRLRAADPGAELALNWARPFLPRPALVDAIKPRWLNFRFGLVSSPLVERAHRDGMLVSAWTADTARTQRRLIGYGVDAITTNRLDVLRGILAGH